MLFVQGTRDAFARWDLLEALVGRLGPRATLYRVEEGDHSFKAPKRAGRSPAELQAAIFAYDEAIRLNPHYAHAFNNRGIIFLELGDIERAIADFDKAIAEEPDYANEIRNRALARALRQLSP